MQPKSFVVFYSEATSLSLSNTSGQVKLIDPFGNSISATNAYETAKDGNSWALANGKWYWSTSPTASAANIIKQPLSKKEKAAAKSKKSAVGTNVKGAKTTKPVKTTALAGSIKDEPVKTPIHPRALALIAGLALLYGAYEYRADMANRVYQLRRYLSARRANRG